MSVIRSLKRTPGLLREHPILFVPVLIVVLIQFPQLFVQTMDPIVSSLVSFAFSGLLIFVMPFFFGGLIGMANDATTEHRTSLSRFLEHGKEYYLSILGAYLLVTGLGFVLGFAISIAVVVGLAGVFVTEGSSLAVAVVALIVLALIALYLAVMAIFQFFGHAIVLEGARAFDGLRRSVEVVRNNLLTVAGYYAILIVGGVIAGGLYVAVISWLFPPASPGEPAPLPGLGPALVGVSTITLVATIFGGIFVALSVLFYRSVTGLDGASANDPAGTTTRL